MFVTKSNRSTSYAHTNSLASLKATVLRVRDGCGGSSWVSIFHPSSFVLLFLSSFSFRSNAVFNNSWQDQSWFLKCLPSKTRNELHCSDLQWSTISYNDLQWATISYNYNFLQRATKITDNDRLSFVTIIIIIVNLTLIESFGSEQEVHLAKFRLVRR